MSFDRLEREKKQIKYDKMSQFFGSMYSSGDFTFEEYNQMIMLIKKHYPLISIRYQSKYRQNLKS